MWLEEWVRNKIQGEIESFQLFRLRRTLSLAYEKSAFYGNLFQQKGFKPEDLQSLGDMVKVPFTEPANLAQSPYKFLCTPLGEVARIFTLATSGTTGLPKKVFFTEGDLEVVTDHMGAVIKTTILSGGLNPGECVVHIFLPNRAPLDQADLVAKATQKIGSLPVIGDTTASTEEQIETIKRVKPTILMGSFYRIYRITQEARLSYNIGEWGVKILFITSEYVSRSARERMESCWKAEVYHHYGMTEMGLSAAIECQAHDGFHINEADFLFEVIDPATGEVLKEGEKGEIVFTTLSREGMPLIRYRTGDIARLIHQPCQCGASTLRVGKIVRRVGGIARIGRGEIYPSLFDDALYEIPELIDYRIFLSKEGERDGLTCKAEVAREKGVEEGLLEAILNLPPIKESIEADLMTQPKIELVKLGELRRRERGKQRIMKEQNSR